MVKRLGLHFHREQRRELAKLVDANGDGHIDLNEFEKAFVLPDACEAWKREVAARMLTGLYAHRFELDRLFRRLDADGSGTLQYEEFLRLLQLLNPLFPCPLSELQARELFDLFDTDGSGTIDRVPSHPLLSRVLPSSCLRPPCCNSSTHLCSSTSSPLSSAS
jgi:Ca2+-binding EF-hand superfamily protein